jgi:hypothetical protein
LFLFLLNRQKRKFPPTIMKAHNPILLLTLLGAAALSASAQINFSSGSPYQQNFDTLASTSSGPTNWTDNQTLPGWYAAKAVGGTITNYVVGAGAANGGAIYSFGSTNATDRALGSVSSGTPGTLAYGIRFKNDTDRAITNITVSYTGEQWRNGGNANVQTLAFAYFTSASTIESPDPGNSSTWTPVNALDFKTPIATATAAPLDGNAAANRQIFSAVLLTNAAVFPGQEIFLRWLDINDSGNDHGFAVDDLTVTFTSTDPIQNPISIPAAGQPVSRTNNAGTSAIFSVNASGSSPRYQWYKDGSMLYDGYKYTGTLTPYLTVSNLVSSDAGVYSVQVQNDINSVTSQDAVLTVIDPAIYTQPLSRTNLVGDTANFYVSASGTAPLSYQWRFNGTALDGQTTATLNVANVQAANQGAYSVVVMNNMSPVATVTSAVATLTLMTPPPVRLAQWDFNATNTLATNAPAPSDGAGSASVVGGTKGAWASGTYSDAALLGPANWAWNVSTFPASGANKSAGAQFNISTVGYGSLLLTWEEKHSDTASKYIRLQYSTDGTTFVDGPVIVASDSNFALHTVDLSSISALNNNANCAFRFVTEFGSTATGAGSDAYVATTAGSVYGTGGTIRLDLVRLFGSPYTAPIVTPIPLQIQHVNDKVVLSWSNPNFRLVSYDSLNGPSNTIAGATSPYTNTMGSGSKFFRLVYP